MAYVRVRPLTYDIEWSQIQFDKVDAGLDAVANGGSQTFLGLSNGTDDTATLNALLASGGSFAGTRGVNYLISGSLLLPSSTVLDMTGCTVTLLSGHAVELLKNADATDTDIEVRGGTWNQNQAVSKDALLFTGCTRLVVRNVRTIKSTGSPSHAGIRLTDCFDSVVVDNDVEGGQYGVELDTTTGSQRVQIARNRISNVSNHGIFLGNNSVTQANHVITGNVVNTCGLIGIALGSASAEIIVSNNVVVATTDNGIDIGNGQNITVTGNVVNGCLNGLDADWTTLTTQTEVNCTFSGNTILGATAKGIYMIGPAGGYVVGVSIVGNVIRASASDGIHLQSIGQGPVIGNKVGELASSTAGIHLSINANRLIVSGNTVRIATGATGTRGIAFGAGGGGDTYSGFANVIVHNQCQSCATPIAGTPGTQDVVRGNLGFNPLGHTVTQPSIPATTVVQTNTFGVDCTVHVAGGTVSAIQVGGTATGLTSGTFRVPQGQTITLFYTVAPTWVWFGD